MKFIDPLGLFSWSDLLTGPGGRWLVEQKKKKDDKKKGDKNKDNSSASSSSSSSKKSETTTSQRTSSNSSSRSSSSNTVSSNSSASSTTSSVHSASSSSSASASNGTTIVWPTGIESIRSDYPNYSGGSYHGGTDFGATEGSAVYAAVSGTVVATRNHLPNGYNIYRTANDSEERTSEINNYISTYGNHMFGNTVVIQMEDGNYAIYAHLQNSSDDPWVAIGDQVTAGTQIGTVGNTGNSFGAHLHYEIYTGDAAYSWNTGRNLDPRDYLPEVS